MTPTAEKVMAALDAWEREHSDMARQVILNPIFAILLSRELVPMSPWAANLEKSILETGYPKPDMTLFMTPLATNWRVPFGEVEIR